MNCAIECYCSAPSFFKSFISFICVLTLTNVLAAIVPLAATPGKPIPVYVAKREQ